jgi:hypothetical protein
VCLTHSYSNLGNLPPRTIAAPFLYCLIHVVLFPGGITLSFLTDKYAAARANMNYISRDALQNDDLNQRFMACGHSLGAMAASGQFVDDGSCD